MAATGAARTARRVHRCMYMRTPIGAQVHAARCAVLHPRLSAPHNPPGISAWLHESHCTTCDSVRMRESNRSVWAAEMAVGVWVVMETSGQGGFPVEDIAPGARRGPAAHHAACANLHSCRLQGTTVPFGTTVLEATHQKFIAKEREASEDCSSSTESSHHRLLLECCGEQRATLKPLRGGPCVEPL